MISSYLSISQSDNKNKWQINWKKFKLLERIALYQGKVLFYLQIQHFTLPLYCVYIHIFLKSLLIFFHINKNQVIDWFSFLCMGLQNPKYFTTMISSLYWKITHPSENEWPSSCSKEEKLQTRQQNCKKKH